MKIEFRRFMNSKYMFIILGLVSLCYVLGYILLVTIDHVAITSIRQLFESTYTVFTQFGMLIFSPLVISLFTNDYKDKNVLFYSSAGWSASRYYVSKVAMLLAGFNVAIIAVTVIVAALFRDFSILHVMISYYWFTAVCFIIEISLWAFLFKNFILAFFINFALWITLTVISAIGGMFQYAAYYDASAPLYNNLMQFLDGKPCENVMGLCVRSCIYDLCVFAIVFGFVYIFKKRWKKNGI